MPHHYELNDAEVALVKRYRELNPAMPDAERLWMEGSMANYQFGKLTSAQRVALASTRASVLFHVTSDGMLICLDGPRVPYTITKDGLIEEASEWYMVKEIKYRVHD